MCILAPRTQRNSYRIRSTNLFKTWVHKADLHKSGTLSCSDYVLFKLQQLQKVDGQVILQLTHKFQELNELTKNKDGLLKIGETVPSATQVKELQAFVDAQDKPMSLPDAWELKRDEMARRNQSKHLVRRRTSTAFQQALSNSQKEAQGASVAACHDFKWSRGLWRSASHDLGKIVLISATVYLAAGYMLLAHIGGVEGIDGIYLVVATLTTVGYGDVVPIGDTSRAMAIIMIPFGLVLVSLVVAWTEARRRAKPFEPPKLETAENRQLKALFDTVDTNKNGELSREECVENAAALGVSPTEAGDFFDEQAQGASKLFYKTPTTTGILGTSSVMNSAWARVTTTMVVHLYLPSLIMALLISLIDDISFSDACYFAVATATSTGFGNVTAKSDATKILLVLYMPYATLALLYGLNAILDLYMDDVKGEEITKTIIDSTIWLHKTDVHRKGVLGEADYMLFKLLQMQRVDPIVLDLLINRFEALDKSGDGQLQIGVDVPSAEQVAQKQEFNRKRSVTVDRRAHLILNNVDHTQ